jgi:hypothetical protein
MKRKIIIIIKNISKYISLFLLGYSLPKIHSLTLDLGILLGMLYIVLELKEM